MSTPTTPQGAIARAFQNKWAKRVAIVAACLLILGFTGKVLAGWYAEIRAELRETQEQIEEVDDETGDAQEAVQDARGAVQDSSAILAARIEALEAEVVFLRARLTKSAEPAFLEKMDVKMKKVVADQARSRPLPTPKSDKVQCTGKVQFKE